MKGRMIMAPMGSGKSYYIKNCIPESYKDVVLDGDELLKGLQIKNRNDFWYDETKEKESYGRV